MPDSNGIESHNNKSAYAQPRVCMMCRIYLPYYAGASLQAHRLAQSLLEHDLQVFVLTGRYRGQVAEEIVEGVPVKRVKVINSGFTLIGRLSLALNTLPALFRLRRSFDILHIHSVGAFDFLPILVARLLGKKTMVKMTLLGSPDDPATWATSHVGSLMRLSFALTDRVVSISTPLSSNYRQSGLDVGKLREMPQGVDISRFRPVSSTEKAAIREKLGLQRTALYVCFVGSMKKRKGADILVDTFIALAEMHPSLNLLVVGPDTFDDPIRVKLPYAAFADKLKERIRQTGLAQRVVFSGQVDNVELWLQASDLFMFPSRREGLPTAIIEAMAVGLPCVLASLDGISAEIGASSDTARIVDSESPEHYVEQISTLLAAPHAATQMGRRARQRVEEAYEMGIVAARYIELYRELLRPRAGDG